MERPKGNEATYVLTYEECMDVISSMRFGNESDIFGKENVENDGVYRVDFEKMELEKISEETYDWIFANSDKLYGVKQKMWGLYSTIEEVKYNESGQ